MSEPQVKIQGIEGTQRLKFTCREWVSEVNMGLCMDTACDKGFVCEGGLGVSLVYIVTYFPMCKHLTHFTGVPVPETDPSCSESAMMVNGHPKSLTGKGLITSS